MLSVLMGFVASSVCAHDTMLGAIGGVSFANLRGDDVFNNSAEVEGAGGLFLRHTWTDIFSLEPEALFAMKGAQFEAQGTQVSQSIGYIEIPVLARATWPNQSNLKPAIFVGPALGILLSNEIEDGAEIDLKDGSKNADFGVVFGGGVDYMLAKGSILLDARYELGLISTMEESVGTDVKNSVISIMAGYGMRF